LNGSRAPAHGAGDRKDAGIRPIDERGIYKASQTAFTNAAKGSSIEDWRQNSKMDRRIMRKCAQLIKEIIDDASTALVGPMPRLARIEAD